MTLLSLVDFRRGFLFSAYTVRTPFYAFTPLQLVLFFAGAAGMVVSYRTLRRLEPSVDGAARYLKLLAFTALTLLIVDLFTYRGVPAARSIAAGRINADWLQAFGVSTWWRPVAQATSYLLTVWHATFVGVLISGLVVTILPMYFEPYFAQTGFAGSMFGALFALPQPFCSCCSSVMAPAFARRGASTSFLLAFVVGAPMLNVTTIVLALALLPAPFAVTRIVAGVVVSVIVTYGVARVGQRWPPQAKVRLKPDPTENADEPSVVSGFSRTFGWFERFYTRLLNVDRFTRGGRIDTPSQLIASWLSASGRIALVLVPVLWIWSVVAAAVFQALPAAFGNNLTSVAVSAAAGTFFMISTWSEIPMALQLIQAGLPGPAAALLVVLPAISLPCMMLLGGALQRFRMVALLSAAVMIVGIAAGALFL